MKLRSVSLKVLISIFLFTAIQPHSLLADESGEPSLGESPRLRKKKMPQPTTGGIQIKAPSSNDFFREGRQIFPENFQAQIQSGPEVRPSGAEEGSEITSNDYPVGPGDEFLINFWGRIEDSLIVSVNSERQVFIPRIGVVDATGLTFSELQSKIKQAINSTLRDVNFTISLRTMRTFTIYVLGEVSTPGPVKAKANIRASEILTAAGGVRATGSRQFIEIRRGEKTLRLDLLSYQTDADFRFNPFVTENDLIFVPKLSEFATISGAVVRPGTFEIKETRKLSEVIEKLGGLSVYADRSSPIRLSRLDPSGTRRQINVSHKSQGGGHETSLDSVLLQYGDEIFVPSSQLLIPSRSNSVFITGEVKKPGSLPFQISSSVEEYIGASGGLTERADFSASVVYKANGTSNRISPRMTIEPGDTIFIPEKTFKFWQDHLEIVTAFIGLATSVIVLSGK